jgi:predicted enzyme related to lactoylglutathione lyase
MGRVVHFEIHADDPERAVKFYQSVFNWEFSRWGEVDYWLIKTGPVNERGIDGGLIKRKTAVPAEGQSVNSYVCTIEVKSVDQSSKAVEDNGGKIVVPKMAVQNVGWLVYCKDTEENIFGIIQNDVEAK